MLLIADKLDGGHVLGVSIIPVIIHARASPFQNKKKSQRHLRLIDTKYWNFINHDKNLDSSNLLHNFHQNIRGLRSKIEELILPFERENINPHKLCVSEHQMEEHELLHLTLSGYTLRSSFSHKHLQRGGFCIFVRKDLNINKIDISHICREKDTEICAVELETKEFQLIILSVYIAPTGEFNLSLKNQMMT